jgi:sarcosine oxidase subunit delta
MMLLPCPWCGDRPEGEFVCLGEAVHPRPRDPGVLADVAWAAMLCDRENRRGAHRERWAHQRGCGTIFVVTRDTLTHDIASGGGSS